MFHSCMCEIPLSKGFFRIPTVDSSPQFSPAWSSSTFTFSMIISAVLSRDIYAAGCLLCTCLFSSPLITRRDCVECIQVPSQTDIILCAIILPDLLFHNVTAHRAIDLVNLTILIHSISFFRFCEATPICETLTPNCSKELWNIFSLVQSQVKTS